MLPLGTLRRLIPALFLLALRSAAAFAQLDPHDGGNDPVVSPDTVRFNCVVVGETAKATFTISNTTGRTVYVEEYRPGRLADPFSLTLHGQDSILNNGRFTDTIRFTPRVPGIYTTSFKIHQGHGGGDLTVYVRGVASVPPSVDVDAHVIPFLPDVHAGESSTECIWLHNPSCRSAQVTRLSLPSADYAITNAPPVPFDIGGRDSIQVCLRFTPHTDGMHADTLTVSTANQKTQLVLVGRRVQAGQPSIVIDPSARLRLDSTFVGHTSPAQTIIIYNVGDADDSLPPQPIVLESPDADQFIVVPTGIPGRILHADHADTLFLNIRFAPTQPGLHSALFRLRHSGGDRAPITSPIIGGVGLLAAASGLPGTIKFDSVEAGTTAEQDSAWRLRNDGNVPLEIDSVTIAGADSAVFMVEGPTGQLPPGATFLYDVAFAPIAARAYGAALVVNFHNGDRKTALLAGKGYVVPQPDPRIIFDRPSYDFGCVPFGDTSAYITFHIENNGTRPVTLKEYRLPPGGFETSGPRAGIVIDASSSFTDSIRCIPRMPSPADIGGEFRADVEGGQGSPTTAAISAHVGPPLRPTFTVSLLTFPTVAPGDTSKVPDTAIIGNRSCRVLTITSISGPTTKAFTLVQPPVSGFPIAPNGGNYPLAILFTPPAGSSGDLLDTVVVHAANGSRDTLALRGHADSSGSGRHGADIVSVPADHVSFDTVIVTLADTGSIRLVNRGDADAVIVADSLRLNDASVQDFVLLNRPTADVTLRAASTDALNLTVQFRPGTAATIRNSVHVVFSDGRRGTLDVPIEGAGTPGPTALPATVALPDVVAGDTLSTPGAFHLINLGARGMTLERIEFTGSDSVAFAVVPAGTVLGPHDSIACEVRFIPGNVRAYNVGAVAHFTNGLTATAALSGNGVQRPDAPTPEVITIDSATKNVNEKFTLAVHAYPPLTPAAGVTDVRLSIHLDPGALFMHRVIPAPGTTDSIGFSKENDTIFITRHGTAPLAGNPLVEMEMEGLVTGQATNIVGLAKATLADNGSITISELRNGIVLLSGCEIAHPVSFSRPAAAKLAFPVPARESMTIRYHAATGSYPTLDIINITGIAVRTETLPAGTGEDQDVTVQLAGLPSGMYYVRLRTATVQSMLPVLITD